MNVNVKCIINQHKCCLLGQNMEQWKHVQLTSCKDLYSFYYTGRIDFSLFSTVPP
jgi:hypothetical protein